MGGGGDCTHVGHTYYLGMAYAFCGESDQVLGFKRAGTIEWSGLLTSSGSSFNAITGKRPDPVPSTYFWSLEATDFRYYNGRQVTADSMLASNTGYQIAYTGTTYIAVNMAFIGMNVSTVPQYKLKLRRTTINAILGTSIIGTSDVNPSHIIYDILVNHLDLDAGLLDTPAFIAAADTLRSEGIGLSFLMAHDKKAKDWIDDILRHIDGIIHYDVINGKYTIKLIRDDYNISTIDKLTEHNSFDLVFERSSWVDTFNTVTFKYTDIEATELIALTLIDTASKQTIGQVKAKVVDYPMITNGTTMELVANRAIKKLSYPLAVIKCKISTIDFPNIAVGDVLNLSHTVYGATDLAIRVMSLGGDKEDSTILDLEGTEDIYGVNKASDITIQTSLATGIVWNVDQMVHATVIDTPPELYSFGDVVPIAADPGGLVTYISCVETGTQNSVQAPVYELGTISSDIDDTNNILVDIVFTGVSSLQASTVATDAEWQAGNNTVVIGTEVMIYRDLVDLGAGSWKVTDVIRGAFGSKIAVHSASENIWVTTGQPTAIKLNNINYNLTIAGANPKLIGGSIEKTGTYSYTGMSPYPPASIEASRVSDDITITWSPATRQRGATYYNATNIPAGYDEEIQEGAWLVTWDTGSATVAVPTFTQTEASVKTYTIVSVLNGRYSDSVTVNI